MLCTFCNTARLDNEAPCPQCGAPSPLLSRMNGTGTFGMGFGSPPAASWTSPSSPFTNVQTGQWGQAGQGQFGQAGQQFPPVLPQTPQIAQQAGNEQSQQPVSLLPVPYQPQQQLMNGVPTGPLMLGNALIPVPMEHLEALVPALPEDEHIVHVPPMYTKPRAIIPRYRAISGLLSVLIVTILFCSGAGYYAKASGKLSALSQLYGMAPPASLKPAPTPTLRNPASPVFGPAYNIINSATTNSRIDPVSHASAQPATAFQVGQTIYLTYSVQRPKSPGTVYIKWYTNGAFYQSPPPIPLNTDAISGYTTQKYVQPAEGMVELYWNDQLAIRLFFVVR